MDQLVPPPVEAPKAWTVTPADELLIAAKSRANRFSFALLLLFFRAHGRFPRTQDEIEPATVADVARQLDIGLTSAQTLAGSGRTVERHRADIRTLFGFREASVADGEALTEWLRDHAVAETRDTALLRRHASALAGGDPHPARCLAQAGRRRATGCGERCTRRPRSRCADAPASRSRRAKRQQLADRVSQAGAGAAARAARRSF